MRKNFQIILQSAKVISFCCCRSVENKGVQKLCGDFIHELFDIYIFYIPFHFSFT